MGVSGLPLAWGWRIPFLASIVLVGIGLFIRARIPETPAFAGLAHKASAPIVEVFRHHKKRLLLAAGAGLGFYVLFYVLLVFTSAYATGTLKLAGKIPLTGVAIGSLITIFLVPVVGALSDHVGRRPLIIGGTAVLAAYIFVFFRLIDTKNPGTI